MESAKRQNKADGTGLTLRRSVFSAFVVSVTLIQGAFAGTIYSEKRADSLFPPNYTVDHYKPSNADKRKYVNRKLDYINHNESHVERVQKMAVAAARAFPDLFLGVDLNLLDEYASRHDREKFLKFFSSRLYKAYGKKIKENDGQPVPGFEHHFEMVDRLNATGEDLERQFFLKHNANYRFIEPDRKTYTPLAKLYQLIVKAVDRVDRALSEVSPEEFGKVMESLAAYAKKNPGLISEPELMVAAFFEAPVSEAERIEYLRQYVTSTRSLEYLKSHYKTVSRYDVVNQGSRFREFQYRKQRKAALDCITNSLAHNPNMYLH